MGSRKGLRGHDRNGFAAGTLEGSFYPALSSAFRAESLERFFDARPLERSI
jgi:hypothetical protein